MAYFLTLTYDEEQSHPSRGAWIEMAYFLTLTYDEEQSHPSRGAWIEIVVSLPSFQACSVAPLAGCVD